MQTGYSHDRQVSRLRRMDPDLRDLLIIAQTYFDAAYDMDADKFATVLHPASSVTKVGADGALVVTPIASWLSVVRTLTSPKQRGDARADEILSIHVARDLALLQVRLRVAPHGFTDLLSCLKVDGRWQIVQKVMTSLT